MARTYSESLRQTIVTLGLATLFALIWTHFYLTHWFEWQVAAHTAAVSGFYAAGLALGLGLTLLTDRWLLKRIGNLTVRRCVWLVLALIFVTSLTAALLGMQYRLYFAQWHEPFLSRDWIIQLVFTAIGAIAQYVIFGIRYHGPGALGIILATCWWATRTKH